MTIRTYTGIHSCGNLGIPCVPLPSHDKRPSCAICLPTPVQACGKRWSIAWTLAVWKKGRVHIECLSITTRQSTVCISNKVYNNVQSNSHSTVYISGSVYSICKNPLYIYVCFVNIFHCHTLCSSDRAS
jgi:hypothetical protein